MHFDLTDLRLMVRVAETASLTRGAEASSMSLPAASTRIKHLEDSIGTKLLLRTHQGVTVTPAGHAFLHHARLVLAQIEQLRGDMQEYAAGVRGHLRVFANTTALGEFLPPVLGAYLRTHPDISVDLQERLSPDIVRALVEGQIDIGIVAGKIATETLESFAYRLDRLVLVVPAAHPLAGRDGVDFAETLALDHVGMHDGSALQHFLRNVCDTMHKTLRTRIQAGNFEAACRMVEAGVGVGVMPESGSRRHAQHMGIRIVPLHDAWSRRELHVCMRSLEALPSFARDLVELLRCDARRHAGTTAPPAD